ncbi:hypothetical protein [Lactococcus cremoris]|uniref:YvbJ-like NTF2-like domain-containing protein n=1 Tax=Lactococcus cremoris subsp. tructae TaxID=542833 RepID=A0A2A5SP90_LACLC|nr:hypothetical protein [Lactococcus cremoris]PCS15658.1 hypothetical protein RU92_GL001617 [Lactococcus cremoris subsp. tructae]
MEEKNKNSKLKIIGMIILIVIALGTIGWHFLGNHTTKTNKQTQTSQSSTSISHSSEQQLKTSDKLSEKVVNTFLKTYYTAESNNSNAKDYEPLMTEDAYGVIQSAVKSRGSMGQNGYIMNQKFDQSSLYINSGNQTVFCNVDYHYDIYKDKDDPKSKIVSDFKSHLTIELQYTHKNGEWLVQAITPITITNNVTGEKINE